MNEVLSVKQSGVFSDQGVVCFEFNAFVKAPTKFHHEGLCASLNAIGLSSASDNSDIDTDWREWKDIFLSAVADHIPLKRLKGHNSAAWING